MFQEKEVLTPAKYVGLGSDWEKLKVQKSKPLLDVIRLGLSLEELKILDIFLGRINTAKPDICTVVFSKKDLEMLFGVKKINVDALRKYLRHLMYPVEIESRDVMIALFSYAEIIRSPEGTSNIILTCSEQAKEFIFNVDKLTYVSYITPESCSLTTKYRYILFLYLKENIYKSRWDISFSELKMKLGCTAAKYNQLKYFRHDILDTCKEEIEEKTSVRFDYEYKKNMQGEYILTFKAHDTVSELSRAEEQLSLPQYDVCEEYRNAGGITQKGIDAYGSERLAEYAAACNFEFDKNEIEVISYTLARINTTDDENVHKSYSGHFGRIRYLTEKYALLCAEDNKKHKRGKAISDRFLYFKSMLEKDAYTGITF